MTYNKEKSGIGFLELEEKVPKFVARNGDGVITAALPGLDGIDNNASIVLGRDRTGAAHGGYGKMKRAGAIDLVVGRMAPKSPWTFQKDDREFNNVEPLFNSIIEPRLEDVKLGDQKFKPDIEPVAMDAARIYLSQKTLVDNAFKLVATDNGPLMKSDNPRSAVAMKADHVRIIAREGVKIVTMGAGSKFPENVSSQGHKIIKTYGIDLIAGNGKDPKGRTISQEPLVKGHAMMSMMSELTSLVDNLTGIVSGFLAQQNVVNVAMLTEFGASGAGLVVMDPVSRTTGTIMGLDMIAKTGLSLANLKYNVARFKFEHGIMLTGKDATFLEDSPDSDGFEPSKAVPAAKSPLSRFNTTN